MSSQGMRSVMTEQIVSKVELYCCTNVLSLRIDLVKNSSDHVSHTVHVCCILVQNIVYMMTSMYCRRYIKKRHASIHSMDTGLS